MTYKEALKGEKKTGVKNCSEVEFLAGFCQTLPLIVGAVSPELVFNGAVKRKLSAKDLSKMAIEAPQDVIDLMWE
jgi:hypothetical protein